MNPTITIGAVAIVAIVASGVAAQAPKTADVAKAIGVFPVTVETSLVIRGVPGQIVVITKPARELRFGSRAKDKSGSGRPLAVSLSGTTMTLAPPEGSTLAEGTLRVEAPAFFTVRVEAQDGTVLVDGFGGAVAIVGKGTAARAQSLTGPVEAHIDGGSLTATNLRGMLDLKAKDATFKVQGVGGACHVEAHGGSGELAGLAAGGDFNLSECALRLSSGKGDVTVTSDAAVGFSSMTGKMRFEMTGGTLRGQGNQGPVRVRSMRTDITLDGITGDLDLDASRGNVAVSRVSGSVNAVIFAGDAKFLELQGAARLDMDGGTASVSWTAIAGDRDSVLENRGGDITVRFPGNAVCLVSAKTKSGRISSDLPSIKVPADATEASGSLGQGQRPVITLEADGNIHLTGGAAVPVPPSKSPQ